jgi:hypothetical protein
MKHCVYRVSLNLVKDAFIDGSGSTYRARIDDWGRVRGLDDAEKREMRRGRSEH